MARLIFLDTETTSLDRRTREIWDLAYIIRDDDHNDVEKQWFLPVSLREADPISLKIGNYYQRHPSPMRSRGDARSISNSLVDPHDLWREVASDMRDAIIVGAVPSFDEETIADTLHGRNGLQPTWHYHLVDIETLAAGALGMEPPWNFDEVLARYGLAQHDDRHTALGDARLVRDLYDAWKGQR
jgi:oligoribonuclease (3'-5' exoribonuclease)